MSRRALSVLASAVVLTWTATSSAAGVELEWTAPSECPTATYVQGEVARMLGTATGPQASIRASANVTHDASGSWRVTLVTTQAEGTSGRRSFAAETCQALADATALIVAMAVNPSVVPSPPPPPEAVAPPSEEPPPPAKPTERPASTPWARFSVSASVATDSGLLPSWSFGPEIALAWLPGAFRTEVAAAFAAAQRASGVAHPNEGASFDAWTAGLRVGYAWSGGAFEVGPLAGAELVHLAASGFGGSASFDQSDLLVSLAAGGRLSWSPLPRFSLRAIGQATAPLARPSFVILDPSPLPAEVLHRPPPVTARLTAGVEWNFF